MNNPKFTIMMPLFNHEEFVGEAIESVLSQNFTDFELIICNDGSTDSSLSIAKSYNDSRIIIIDKPNGGVVSALNSCLLKSRGEYICWLSSDDVYMPDKLNYHNFAHTNSKSAISITPFGEMLNGTKKSIPLLGENGIERLIPFMGKNPINGLSICIKKEVYLQHGVFRERFRFSHDFDRWLHFLRYHDPIYIDGDAQSFTRLGSSHIKESDPIFCGTLENLRIVASYLISGLEFLIPAEYMSNQEAHIWLLEKSLSLINPSQNYFIRFGFSEWYCNAIINYAKKFNLLSNLMSLQHKKDTMCNQILIEICINQLESVETKTNHIDFVNYLATLRNNDIIPFNMKNNMKYYLDKSIF